MFSVIFTEIKKNLKNPKLYAFFIVILVFFFVLFPYIDANYFYYKRVADRIDILDKVSKLDTEEIMKNPTLNEEYNRILEDISQQPESSVSNMFVRDDRPVVNTFKFLTGGLLFWALAIACLFMKTIKSIGSRVVGMILCSIAGVMVGCLGRSIPNIVNPWINYIGFPILQIALIALLVTSSSQKKTKEKSSDDKDANL